ncbi:hypothetical protein MD484_g4524, partial [Candolleomyces efflorescens]
MITLYDTPSTLPGTAWSLFTWRIRLSLSYKKIPYKTQWLESPQIAPTLQKLNIPPTKYYDDGSPMYSVPAILDVDDQTGETKAALAESYDIAVYLDEAYPLTPRLFPSDDDTAELERIEKFVKREFMPMWPPSFYLTVCKMMLPNFNPESRERFSKTCATDFLRGYGKERLEDIPLSDEDRKDGWRKVREGFESLEEGVLKAEWFSGSEISFADLVIGALLISIRVVFGEGSTEWKDVMGWSGGRWERFLVSLDELCKSTEVEQAE